MKLTSRPLIHMLAVEFAGESEVDILRKILDEFSPGDPSVSLMAIVFRIGDEGGVTAIVTFEAIPEDVEP